MVAGEEERFFPQIRQREDELALQLVEEILPVFPPRGEKVVLRPALGEGGVCIGVDRAGENAEQIPVLNGG